MGSAGVALALGLLALAASVLLIPIRGHTIEQWAPVAVRFLLGRYSARARFQAQRAQLGHVVTLPTGELDPQRPLEPWSLPAELADLELLEGELVRYEHARFGVAVDRRARTFTAALRVRGRAFALLGSEEREQRLQDYGAVLAALARDDTAVRRVAWIERTLPGDGDALGDYLLEAKRPDATLDEPPRGAGLLPEPDRPRGRCRRGARAAVRAAGRRPAPGCAGARSPGWAAGTSARSRCSVGNSGS